MRPLLRVRVLDNYPADAPAPGFSHPGDSGFDLRASVEGPLVIAPGDTIVVPTGLAFHIPPGHELQVRPRSGLATRGLTVVNAPGTIDRGYRGEVKVILTVLGREAVEIAPGDRIAQAVLSPVPTPRLEVVGKLDQNTARGSRGLGSTGR